MLVTSSRPTAVAQPVNVIPPSKLRALDEKTLKAYELAIALFKEMHTHGIRTGEDVFPCKKWGDQAPACSESSYKALGDEVLIGQEFWNRLTLTRASAMECALELNRSLISPRLSIALATLKEKIGACGELADLVLALGIKNGITVRKVKLSSPGKTDAHALNLVSSHPSCFKQLDENLASCPEQILEHLRTLSGVVVLDPYLRMVVPAQIAEEDAAFVESLASMRAYNYIAVESPAIPHGNPSYRDLCEGAEKIHARMRSLQLLGELSISRLNPPMFILMPELRSFEPTRKFLVEKRWSQVSRRLDELFPDIAGQWKYKKPTIEKPSHAIWININSESRSSEICLKLRELGVDVSLGRVKSFYGIQIPVADFGLPTILEKLTSPKSKLLGETSTNDGAATTAAGAGKPDSLDLKAI